MIESRDPNRRLSEKPASPTPGFDRIVRMEDIATMEWGIQLNAAFAKWFNPLERDDHDEVLAILCVVCEVAPDVIALSRRLDSIKLVAESGYNEQLPGKFRATSLTSYLEKLPKARRRKIETRAAEIRAEETSV